MIRLLSIISLLILGSLPTFAANPPINCGNLPGCDGGWANETETFGIIGSVIETWIQYVAVLAVLAIMFGWVMYLVSSGDEEKTKKAKNIIIWALVGVIISMSAYGLISIINNFRV